MTHGLKADVVESDRLNSDPQRMKIRRSLAAGEVRPPEEIRRILEAAMRATIPTIM